ncbi:glycosyltransferase family 2 protein [Patescibacteria group bacterium]|nr:glycosyltransferase family 2 protein [Patescibacteria group bacterium]
MSLITCLIPFYNESNRIIQTLEIITKINSFSEIICVDDGSDDENYKIIQNKYPKIKLIKLEKNQGKSSAILAGLKQIKTDWVFFLDADLKNLKQTEIETAISSVKKCTKPLDMLILRRSNYSNFVRAIRHDILMSGERILRTKDALAVFKNPPSGYQLEVAINQYMADHNKKCFWQQTSLANSYKITKWAPEQALKKYADEIPGYFKYAGPIKYFKQLTNFCWNELKQ